MPNRAIILAIVSSGPQANDKASIPYQLAEGTALAERNGWNVIATLEVPGFSRDYNNFDECERDMSAAGIPAFAQLRTLWENRAFDILICREASRLGREQSILAEVIQRTIQSGAEIRLTSGGEINKQNYRFMSALLGLAAAKENDERVERFKMGKEKKVKSGLPHARLALRSHEIIRDTYGRRISVQRAEWLVPIMRDVAALVIEGVPWNSIEEVLYQRFGHTDQSGQPFKPRIFWRILHHPYFWGHNVTYMKNRGYGIWAFDETLPAPHDIKVYRHTHLPFWHHPDEANLADQVKSALRHRHNAVAGRALPHKLLPYSGTLICDECHTLLHSGSSKGGAYVYYRCDARYKLRPRQCYQSRVLRNQDIHKYFNDWLSQILMENDFNNALTDHRSHATTQKTLADLTKEIARLQAQLDDLINEKLLTTSITVRNKYNLRIEAIGKRIDTATEEVEQLQRSLTSAEVQTRHNALSEIQRIGLANFWDLPSREINVLLHGVLGQWRLRVRDGEIVGRLRYHRKRMKR